MYKLILIVFTGILLVGCSNLNNMQQRMVSGAAIGGTLAGPIGAGLGAGIGYIVEKSGEEK